MARVFKGHSQEAMLDGIVVPIRVNASQIMGPQIFRYSNSFIARVKISNILVFNRDLSNNVVEPV
jgi:hypothetical protein